MALPKANDYSLEHLLGSTDVTRVTNPTIIASIRRHDPDGTSGVPYIASLSGKHLSIGFTDSSSIENTVEVTFASNSFQAAIDTINAAASTNVEAIDIDGFLLIRNKNQGKAHYIFVQTASTNDGAALFGFRVFPYPGYASFAGEIASSVPTRSQPNTQGTGLIAHGEDLNSATLNRAVATIADLLNRELRLQDKEVIGSAEISIGNVTTTAGTTYIITPPSSTALDIIRIPLDRRLFPASANPENTQPGSLDAFFTITDVNGDEVYYLGQKVKVIGVVYYNPASLTSIDLTTAFSTWSPTGASISTGHSIYYSSVGSPTEGQFVSQVTKQAAASINAIDGNVLRCDTALFQTKLVQPGDTCIIQNSTNNTPFNHNGEFIVERVFDETHIAVRPKAKLGTPTTNIAFAEEALIFTANGASQALNSLNLSSGFGEVVVPIGNFLPARNIGYVTNLPLAASNTLLLGGKLRISCGTITRNADPTASIRKTTGGSQQVMTILDNLISRLTNAADTSPSIDSEFSTSLDSPKIVWRVHAAPNSGPFPGTGIFARLYSLNGNDYTLAMNASWSGSAWVEDNTTLDGLILSVSRTGISIQTHTGGAGLGTWQTTLITDKNATQLFKTLQLALSTTNPLIKSRSTGATSGRTWLGAFNDTVIPINLYINQSTNLLEVTVNAEWDGANWTRPASGNKSSKVEISKTGIRVLIRGTTGTLWTDADVDWDDSIVVAGKFLSSNSLPASNTAIYNQLHNTNTPKAWGSISILGSVGVMTPALINGFNIASVTPEGGSTSLVRVTFAAALDPSALYGVILSGRLVRSPALFAMPIMGGRTSAFFDFSLEKADGTIFDFSDANSPSATIEFIVIGP